MMQELNYIPVSYTHLDVYKRQGLNNLKINSILDERYSEYFGFTSSEVHEMADYYHACLLYTSRCV